MKNNIAAKRRLDLELNGVEALWLEVRCGSNKFLLCTVYRPPSYLDFYDHFQNSLDKAQQSNTPYHVIIGDLNSDPNTDMGCKLNTFANANSLTLHIHQPTRITSNSSTVLDQCLSNCSTFVQNIGVLPPLANNDHCTIHLKLSFKVKSAKCYKRLVWDFSKANVDGYVSYLEHFNWDNCFLNTSVDDSCDEISNAILSAAKEFIPNKVVTIRPYDKSFYNGHLRQMKRKLNRLHERAKLHNTTDLWSQFRHHRNVYIREVQKAKKECTDKRFSDINEYNISAKRFFGFAKECFSKSKDNSMPPIITDDGDIIVNDCDKASHFNNFFASSSRINESSGSLPSNADCKVNKLNEIEVQDFEVFDQIKFLDCNKSYGPDGISPKFIKMAGQTIVRPLTKLFNMSLSQGIFPSNWKKANVLPLHKKSSKQLADNYRPVSLLCIMGKLFERIVFKHVYNHFLDNNLISQWQSGFIPGSSTVTQLLELFEQFSSATDQSKDTRIVFLDISKAFDKVWHKGLLFKLQRFGIHGCLLKWFANYLSNRMQRVVINGQFSDWKTIFAGVPQGSVLGPLLFLVYINDITSVVKYCNVRLFADDTCLFVSTKDHIEAAWYINEDLKHIEEWARQWIVKFSPTKTESMVLSLKTKSDKMYPRLLLSNTPIANVQCHKHIGLWISNNFKWDFHIKNLVDKCSIRLGILKSLKFKLNRKALETIFTLYIRPILEYADIIWSGAPQHLLSKLDYIINEAMRIVTGAPARSSVTELYKETGWLPLNKRREMHVLKMMFGIANNLCPAYLSNIVPSTVRELPPQVDKLRQNINSRISIGDIPIRRTRLKLFDHLFPAIGTKLWNALPSSLKSLNTISSFKKELQKLYSPINSSHKLRQELYGRGSRYENGVHSCFRMRCSKLKVHLKNNLHVIDDESCSCGYPTEDVQHFLFSCPLYDDMRNNLLHSVQAVTTAEVTTDLLLFGSEELTKNQNFIIIDAVQLFLKDTKRFS